MMSTAAQLEYQLDPVRWEEIAFVPYNQYEGEQPIRLILSPEEVEKLESIYPSAIRIKIAEADKTAEKIIKFHVYEHKSWRIEKGELRIFFQSNNRYFDYYVELPVPK